MDSIAFDPVMRPALLWILSIALAAMIVLQARRSLPALGWFRAGLTCLLRLGFAAGLAILLMRPMTIRQDPREGGRSVFSIVLDRSASMATSDAGGATREAAAAQALADARPELDADLGRSHTVNCYDFADRVRPQPYANLATSAAPEGDQTDIAAALMAAAESGGPYQAGILLISDGRANGAGGSREAIDAARFLRARNIPVWTASVGSAGKTRDAFVSARLDQNFLFVRQPGSIQATIDQSGYKDWSATVHLRREGVEVGVQQTLLGDGPTQISFPVREEAAGLFEYAVSVDPLLGEADTHNNQRTVFVRATDRHTQVLVLEAQPYWDTKFLVRALSANPDLDVTSIFKLSDRKSVTIHQAPPQPGRDPNSQPETIRIPQTRDELFAYDIVILGRGAEQLLNADQMKLLRDFVSERGGNLIFARGKPIDGASEDLAALDPIDWGEGKLDDVRLSLTAQGSESPLFTFKDAHDSGLMIRELPEMLSVTRANKEKSLAVVLARVEGTAGLAGAKPLAAMAWQRYGKGKVLSVGMAGMWRWSLLPDSLERYQNIYREFWMQTLGWMSASSDFLPDQQITLEVNRNTFRLGENALLTIRTRGVDAAKYRPVLEVAEDGDPNPMPIRLDPQPDTNQEGVYTASFAANAEGEFRATLVSNIGLPEKESVRFTAYQDSIERRFTAADPGLMAQIARITGGDSVKLEDLKNLPAQLKQFEAAAVDRPRPVDAWDKPWIFFAMAGLLLAEWMIRRMSGMV